MKAGLAYAAGNSVNEKSPWENLDLSAKDIIVALFSLFVAIVPLFVKNKTYHTVQLALNVIALGLWSGKFVSYSLILGWFSNGTNVLTGFALIVLAVTAFVYPLFGKHQYYCTNVCPFGSIQQLTAKCNKGHKWKLGNKWVKRLTRFRQVLWAVLMLLLWSGILTGWSDFEFFTAFAFESASWIVIALSVLTIVLSLFITRPYCRFVCPTGTLLKLSENLEKL